MGGAIGNVHALSEMESQSLNSQSEIGYYTVTNSPNEPDAVLLLNELKLVPADGFASFFETHQGISAKLLRANIPAGEVHAWWQSLDYSSRAEITRRAPELVGNLEGIVYSDRDRANRKFLDETIRKLEHELERGVGRGKIVAESNQLSMLKQIKKTLDHSPQIRHRNLIQLDVKLPGEVVISIGDLDNADYVSYLIPGMFFTVEGQVGAWVDTADALYKAQSSWLNQLGKPGESVATVAWIGYQTPHLLNVGSLDLALEGAKHLSRSISGLQAERPKSPPFLSVMAHSYGSTATMLALQEGSITLDAFAMIGSPGAQAQTVGDLSMSSENVFVAEASFDPVCNSAFYGSDPGSKEFGARRFGVNGGVDPITDRYLSASEGHNEYFRPGSESLRNLALIGIGEGALTMGSPTQ